jgi:hypothetical protein
MLTVSAGMCSRHPASGYVAPFITNLLSQQLTLLRNRYPATVYTLRYELISWLIVISFVMPTGLVARMRAQVSAYKIYVGKKRMRPLGRPRRAWEDSI